MSEWNQIPSLPGRWASSCGKISHHNRILAQHIHDPKRFRYFRVQVWVDGKSVWRRVNRLVCEAFHGAPPEEGMHARHLNGDSFDNRRENLAWGSAMENYLDQVVHGTAHMPPVSEPVKKPELWFGKPSFSKAKAKLLTSQWQSASLDGRAKATKQEVAEVKKAHKTIMLERLRVMN